MFGLKRKKKKEEQQNQEKKGMFSRLRAGLGKTRSGLAGFVPGTKKVDEDTLEELETSLLVADVGVDTTTTIVNGMTARLKRKALRDGDALVKALKEDLHDILEPVTQPLVIPEARDKPFVILVVGVNGAGKTTTIGKLAKLMQQEGLKVMLAAGDTFRAAAVEQLKTWGERNDVVVVAQERNADPASVVFDALQSATAKGVDVLIADTAGRLHTQDNLMDELKKIKRVMTKLDDSAPHEVLLVLDAGLGQNALKQAQQFHAAMGVSGLVLTKLDGTAKGGVIFAIAKSMRIPIRFIGVGESIEDLREFDATEFVDALIDSSESSGEQAAT